MINGKTSDNDYHTKSHAALAAIAVTPESSLSTTPRRRGGVGDGVKENCGIVELGDPWQVPGRVVCWGERK